MANESFLRLALAIVSLLQCALSSWRVRLDDAVLSIFQRREEGLRLTVALIVANLLWVGSVIVYLLDPRMMAWAAVDTPYWLRWIGMVPLTLGVLLSTWGFHYLGSNLTISISTKAEHCLITSGPYQWIRHPLYTGGMIQSFGLALLTSNWFVAFSGGMFWLLIAYRTPLEEEKLMDRFGEAYGSYQRNVGRFIPNPMKPGRPPT